MSEPVCILCERFDADLPKDNPQICLVCSRGVPRLRAAPARPGVRLRDAHALRTADPASETPVDGR